MEKITFEEVMNKLDTFQARFVKVDELCWWDLKIIQPESSTKFTFKEFQEGIYIRGVQLT